MLPIEDALLSILVAGAVGLLLGSALTTFVMRRLRRSQALRAAGRPARGAGVPVAPRRRRQEAPPLPLAADLLLVDDSAVARAKLRKLFTEAGYKVHLANDGVEALARLGEGRYAMMITDLEMPNMDGVTLINTCLGQPRTAGMPIVAVSGHQNLRAMFDQCRQVCGVHPKPWVDDILLSHVATLVPALGARRPVDGAAAADTATAGRAADGAVSRRRVSA